LKKRTIVTMPGDGIGETVLSEAIRVLDAVGFETEYVEAGIGWEYWKQEGNPLPERTLELLEEHGIGLFGAITSKPKWSANDELAPRLRGEGLTYFSPIVKLRQHFDLDVCIRPCRTFAGNPLNFVRRAADRKGIDEPLVDTVIFRQNTEGLYSGVEWTDPPAEVRSALETHPRMAAFRETPGADLAISCRIFTRAACRRIVRAAFEYARKHGYDSVTVCEKPNVIRETSGMLEMEAKEIAGEFEGIALRSTNIDAQMMWLTKNPEEYGVIVAGNMFGDIISDGFAGLVGGLGFACSANIGSRVAVFEPTHGSAPKYAELSPSIVNPIAMILSACMMLDHLGEAEMSARIRVAIGTVIEEGKARCYDMLRLAGGPGVSGRGAATTREMTDAVIEQL
jgi:isocitrate dehydrogenase (NAD+)